MSDGEIVLLAVGGYLLLVAVWVAVLEVAAKRLERRSLGRPR